MAPRALTITLEAKSDEHLRKLLELALFDLDKVRERVASTSGELSSGVNDRRYGQLSAGVQGRYSCADRGAPKAA